MFSNFSLNVVAAKHNIEQASLDTADLKSFNYIFLYKIFTKNNISNILG